MLLLFAAASLWNPVIIKQCPHVVACGLRSTAAVVLRALAVTLISQRRPASSLRNVKKRGGREKEGKWAL